MKDFKPKAWMLPQPVLIIGTYNADGTPNAMNAAWGGQWDYEEIMISMGAHATTDNLNRCGDFTVAFATADTLAAADYVGLVSAKTHPDKMARAGWQHVDAAAVKAPVFTAFPMTLECRIKEKLYESETGYYIIAEIVNIVCDEKYLAADGKPDVEAMHLITFDPVHNGYIALGARVGNAFSDGNALKKMSVKRCFWANPKNPLYISYHDNEWGRPVHDDRKLLELLLLESFQAGLSWECILNKREAFREAFDGFDLDKILAYDDEKVASLLANPGIIRNKAKIAAAITNARVFKEIQAEYGSFDAYLCGMCPADVVYDHVSTTSPLSDALSADLRRRGMKFMGSTTVYAFLQSIGVINSHQPDCFLCAQQVNTNKHDT